MGFQPGTGIANIAPVPQGEQANQLLSGSFVARGTSLPINPMGPFNLLIYAQQVDTLTVTAASASFTLATGGEGAGAAVNSTLVPPGTTISTLSGTNGTFAFPKRQLSGVVSSSTNVVTGIGNTAYLMGATVTGTGIPSGTTVTAIVTPSVAVTNLQPGSLGSIQLSNTPTVNAAEPLTFQLAAAGAVAASGADAAAIFTGYGITYSATVQLERSFDGGYTWLLCGIGGQGIPAQFTVGTPISVIGAEVERGVCYRLNCTAYTSGTIEYRISATGQAALSLSIPVSI